jgi:hypothetical protein
MLHGRDWALAEFWRGTAPKRALAVPTNEQLTKWGTRRYLDMKRLAEVSEAA